MKKLMITTMCLAVAGYVHAQEAATAATDGVSTQTIEVAADGGADLANKVLAGEEGKAPVDKKFKSSKKLLKELAKQKNWKEGWDKEKGRIIIVESYSVDTKDPSHDKVFFTKREMAAKAAVLKAKVGVIEMINTEMDGSELLDMPGTDVNKELGAEREKIAQIVEAQRVEMMKLLAQKDAAEEAVNNGTTFSQRLDDMLAAMIKKLDENYDKNAHNEAAKAKFAELKAKAEASKKMYDDLKARADKLQLAVKERHESKIKMSANMPIFGVTVILQTESFNQEKGKYEVAILATWSKALEAAARGIALGKDVKGKPGKCSVQDWLAKQDLATMIGPRQYVDDKGTRWFLGVTARVYDDDMPSVKQRKAKGIVDSFARQMAVFSVFSDVDAKEEASQAKETRGNDETEEYIDSVCEDYATKMSQKFAKKTIRGMQRLADDEVEHPITGDEIYVAVWGLNASDAKDALAAETSSYATKIEAERYQSMEKGRKAANEAAVRAATNRPEDFQAGARKQTNALASELGKRQERTKKGGVAIKQNATGTSSKKNKQSQGGTFGGDTDVGDDF